MLQKLIIRNYAIIDNLTIEPAGQLNIVTGETGAGKSIILGALSLILGERADTSVLINKEEKCVVEAHFDVSANASFNRVLREEDIDEEQVCIIRREISASGKSRAIINDSPVTLNVLNRLTALLVDLHQQFGHLALEDDHFQMDVLDALAANGALKEDYSRIYKSYTSVSLQLNQLRERQLQWQKESDYKQYLFDELSQASLKENEIEDVELQLKQLSNAGRIITILQTSRNVLEEGDQPISNEIRRIHQQLQTVSDVLRDLEPLGERLASVYAELKDIASELGVLEHQLDADPATMQQLQERLDLGYKLCKKHGVQSTAELLSIQQQLEGELQQTLELESTITTLEKQKQELYTELEAAGKKLSASRQKIAPQLQKKLNELLHLVGMPNAQFRPDLECLPTPGPAGLDQVTFRLDANKSGQFLPVYKAASGGEMSRIMLCLKSLTAKAMHLPTLIFDEVDTGISGEAARQVGMLLQDLGRHHQVICITHQPQVAARGSRHFFVHKDLDAKKKITTRVRVLAPDERVVAIARMIGGEAPSEAAIQNARELVMN